MASRAQGSAPRRPWKAALLTCAAILLSATMWAPSAGATTAGHKNGHKSQSHKNTVAHLSLTGVVTGNYPLGGAEVDVHPGDSVDFTAALLPTSEIAPGLSQLLEELLGYRVLLDASGLPGGEHHVDLSTNSDYKITFQHAGRYHLTWSGEYLLGSVNLDLNLLAALGIRLNASETWQATVVVAQSTDPAIALQLPSISLNPTLGTTTLTHITVPSIGVPPIGGTTGGTGGGNGGGGGGTGGGTGNHGGGGGTNSGGGTGGHTTGSGTGSHPAPGSTPTSLTGHTVTPPPKTPPKKPAPKIASPFIPVPVFFALPVLLGVVVIAGLWVLWAGGMRKLLGR